MSARACGLPCAGDLAPRRQARPVPSGEAVIAGEIGGAQLGHSLLPLIRDAEVAPALNPRLELVSIPEPVAADSKRCEMAMDRLFQAPIALKDRAQAQCERQVQLNRSNALDDIAGDADLYVFPRGDHIYAS